MRTGASVVDKVVTVPTITVMTKKRIGFVSLNIFDSVFIYNY